jgi:hypothetical protein
MAMGDSHFVLFHGVSLEWQRLIGFTDNNSANEPALPSLDAKMDHLLAVIDVVAKEVQSLKRIVNTPGGPDPSKRQRRTTVTSPQPKDLDSRGTQTCRPASPPTVTWDQQFYTKVDGRRILRSPTEGLIPISVLESNFRKSWTDQSSRPLPTPSPPHASPGKRSDAETIVCDTIVLTGHMDTSSPAKTSRADRALAMVFGKDSTWRSAWQRSSCQLVMDTKDNLLLVGPTAAGKTLLWLLPALSEEERGKTTVVISPFRALKSDLMARCEQAGIRPFQWTRNLGHDRRLVFASIEHVSKDTFLSWLNILGERLERIVFEEAHLALTAHTYRPEFGNLSALRAFPVPKILITATAPPSLQDALIMAFGLSGAQISRQPSNRLNIRYLVTKHRITSDVNKIPWDDLRAMTRMAQSTYKGQVLVFCGTVALAIRTAEELRCEAHYSALDIKDEVFQRFSSGETRILAATAGMGAGVDIAGLSAVIHLGSPASPLDFHQESGRCGRTGKPSVSIIMPSPPRSPVNQDRNGQDVLEAMMRSKGCRRQSLSRWMDGDAVTCDELASLGGLYCDNCRVDDGFPAGLFPRRTDCTWPAPHPPRHKSVQKDLPPTSDTTTTSPGVSRVASSSQQTAVFLDSTQQKALNKHKEQVFADMRVFLDKWAQQTRCALCLAAGEVSADGHETSSCPDLPASWFAAFQDWKKGFNWPGQTCCWRCWLPKPWNDMVFHSGHTCRFPDLLPEFLYRLQELDTGAKKISALAGHELLSPGEYQQWLNANQGVRSIQRPWLVLHAHIQDI